MTEHDSGPMAEWLADHPRMIGAVFAALLVLSQAGSAAAGITSTTGGP